MEKKCLILTIFIFFLFILYSCENPFAPPLLGPWTFKPIVQQISPDSVLHNFKYAYEYRDSLVYENCLDCDFIFYYKDQDQLSQTGEVWVQVPRDGKGGDVYRTNRLFRVFDDIRLDTWIVRADTAEIDTTTGERWEVRNVSFHLSLRDTDGDYSFEHLEATGFAKFMFRKSEDGWWRIVRWYDRSL